MCRSIKVLRVPGRRATDEELTAAALQFVRKISGSRKPSRANQQAFDCAVAEIAASSKVLLKTMTVPEPPKASLPAEPAAVSSNAPTV
jgi:hypothetical protein